MFVVLSERVAVAKSADIYWPVDMKLWHAILKFYLCRFNFAVFASEGVSLGAICLINTAITV